MTDHRHQENLQSVVCWHKKSAVHGFPQAPHQLQPAPAVVVAQTTGFDAAKEVDAATAKLIRAAQRVATAAIWFGIVWLPILLVLAIGAVAALFVVRWLARRWGRLQPADMLEPGGTGAE